mmetsp:Transcript_19108/g.8890  ORF Transcript_19108/g.8890 Transcript_19108/m.8890 type:complete len:257 (+) Transcript_19108:2170-2940(+)
MQDLKITIIQTEIFWEDIKANLDMFDEKLNKISEQTDLIILPEMFSTGFSMNTEKLAENMNGSAVNWIKHKSTKKHTDIAGSIIIKEKGNFFNRLVWAKPDNTFTIYDKKHLFRMADENKAYSAGESKITVNLNGWKVRPFICYDLRFPVWTRNFDNEYDLAVYIANWPEPRSYHWKTLLKARAIENQCYVAGVNRIGQDGNDVLYSGDSLVIDPLGNPFFEAGTKPCVNTVKLSYEVLKEYRTAFPTWMDADYKS